MQQYLIVGGVVLALAAANWWQYKSHEDYVEDHAQELTTLKSSNADLDLEVTKLKNDKVKLQAESNQIGEARNELKKELDLTITRFDTYKKRISTVDGSPGLVTIFANKAADMRNVEIACKTGDLESCETFNDYEERRKKAEAIKAERSKR